MNLLWGPTEDEVGYGHDPDDLGEAPVLGDGAATFPPSDQPELRRRRGLLAGRQPQEEGDLVELRPGSRPQTEVHYPRSFADAQNLADQYKQGAFLIVDLEQVEERERARLVNFLCGVAYGRDGKSHKINEVTFVFAPRHFELDAELPRRDNGRDSSMPQFNPPRTARAAEHE